MELVCFFSLQFFLFLFTVQRNGKIQDNNEILPTPITIIAWLHAVSMDLPDNDSCVFYVLSPLEYSWDMVRHICGYRNRFEFFRYKQVRNSRGSFRSGSPSRSDSLSVPTGVVLQTIPEEYGRSGRELSVFDYLLFISHHQNVWQTFPPFEADLRNFP